MIQKHLPIYATIILSLLNFWVIGWIGILMVWGMFLLGYVLAKTLV
jgi:hypothetical protein